MHFAVLFEDNPGHEETRNRLMPDHLAFIEASDGAIVTAGPLSEAGVPAGGLWLVRARDAASVRSLVEADPFWATGLRKSVRILAWRQVYAEGARRV